MDVVTGYLRGLKDVEGIGGVGYCFGGKVSLIVCIKMNAVDLKLEKRC